MISIPDRGVTRLPSLINISSKRPAPASAGSPSTRPPTQRFRLSPVPPPSTISRLPHMQSLSISIVVNVPPAHSSQLDMQLNYSTPHTSQRAAYFAAGELNKILSNPVAAKEYDNKEVRYFRLQPEQSIIRAPQRILRSQAYAKRPQSPETLIYEASVEGKEESAPRLQTEQEEHIVEPLGGGSFFKYRLVVSAKL